MAKLLVLLATFQLVSSTWTELNTMSEARLSPGVVDDGDTHTLVLGGYSSSNTPLDTFEYHDMDTDEWWSLPPMPSSCSSTRW